MKTKLTLAVVLLLGLSSTVEGHRLLARHDEEDADEVELNGTALKN